MTTDPERKERTEALGLDGIVVRYGERTALRVPLLRVEAGEVLALVGPNGAGKSTLLHVAALLRAPDAGEVRIGGEAAGRRSAGALRRRIAVVFQDPLLFDVGVLANAASGLRFRGVARREAERRAGEWLARFGVAHLARRSARALSGGEARRVGLARAFAVAPELLLLDEPFAALDAPSRAVLVPELAARLRETGTAAVVVTHDRAEAVALGDRLGVLLDGRLSQVGPAEEVLARPASASVASFLGIDNVLGGHVVAVGGRVEVRLDGSARTVSVAAPPDPLLRPGDRVDVAVPAEVVAVVPAGEETPPGQNGLPGVVASVVPLPLGQRVVVDCGAGVVLTAVVPRAAGRPGATPGHEVVVAFPAEGGHLMPRGREPNDAGR